MRIKNWKKVRENCWKLRIKPKKYGANTVCFKLGYGNFPKGNWIVYTNHRIEKRAKTKTTIYKKAITWMRKHPNG